MSVLTVLTRARDAQKEYGFVQNVFARAGDICTMSAIMIGFGVPINDCVQGWSEIDLLPQPELQEVLEALGFGSVSEACEWNNEPGRTSEDVVARFEQAIARQQDSVPA